MKNTSGTLLTKHWATADLVLHLQRISATDVNRAVTYLISGTSGDTRSMHVRKTLAFWTHVCKNSYTWRSTNIISTFINYVYLVLFINVKTAVQIFKHP